MLRCMEITLAYFTNGSKLAPGRGSNSCPIGGEVKFPHTAALRFRLNVPDTCIYTPVVFYHSVLIKTRRSVTATAQLKQNVSKNNNYGRRVCGMKFDGFNIEAGNDIIHTKD